jgi:spore germination protein
MADLNDWVKDKRGILALVLALALLATGYWGYQRRLESQQLETHLNNRYEYSFQEFNDHLDRLQEQLGALVISQEADNLSVNLSNVWRSAYAAHEDVGQLPLNSDALDKVKQLLDKTSRYANHLDRQVTERELTAQEKETLETFYQEVKEISKELETVHDKMRQNQFTWHDKKRINIEADNEEYSATPLEGLAQLGAGINLEGLNNKVDKIDTEMNWDESQGLSAGLMAAEGENVSEKEAIKAAKRVVRQPGQYDYDTIDEETIEVDGRKAETDFPVHSVRAVSKENESRQIYIDVNKKGGQVLSLLNRREIGEKEESVDEAIESGEKFLAQAGYEKMTPISFKTFSDLFMVSFAPRREDVIIKPKRVLMEVALDNGEVTGFNAAKNVSYGKVKNEDNLDPELSLEEAKEKVSDKLELKKKPQLVLDRVRGKERLCYEFVGNIKGETGAYKIKIDANTGQEADIKSIEDDIYQLTK